VCAMSDGQIQGAPMTGVFQKDFDCMHHNTVSLLGRANLETTV